MYGSGRQQENFEDFSVYEVISPAPDHLRGWYWELKSTYESAGPYTGQGAYHKAVAAGRARTEEVKKK